MVKELLTPDYIFEASWEVCNKVGGIYTVLSTRANTLQTNFHDRVFLWVRILARERESFIYRVPEPLCRMEKICY